MTPPPDLTIRPVLLQDAEALWVIARQEGVIETTMALPSLRLEQRMKSISALSENDHYMVAEKAGEVVGIAGVSGNGQSELVEVLSGQRPLQDGEIRIHGKSFEPKRGDFDRFSELIKDKAGYRLMEDLGTKPRVYYLPPVNRSFPFESGLEKEHAEDVKTNTK